jgi:hypothetical protein
MSRKRALNIIHVRRSAIVRNTKDGTTLPAITFKKKYSGTATVTNGAVIVDDAGNEIARVVYRPDQPLKCGARCWIETRHKVITEAEFEGTPPEAQQCLKSSFCASV